jgi:hypothetical protein
MSFSARVLALVAIGAVILAGAFALVSGGSHGGPLPSTAPRTNPSSATSSAAASSAPALTEMFTSPAYGYSIRIPTGWATRPATRIWSSIGSNLWGSGFNDELSSASAGVRFSGTSMALATGQSAEDWLTSYAGGADRAGWKEIPIDGETGYLTADGVAAASGTISPGGLMYDAVVISGDRAYNFNMDGKVDRAMFDAFVGTVVLDAASVGALPPLEKQFKSPWYGYAIARSGDWTVTPATAHWKDVDNSPPKTDEILITGTDTRVSGASQALGKQTLDEFLVPFHANTTANVPAGCDGGDPSTWQSTAVGSTTARWYELCNAAEAVVELGGRVYVFTWGNDTFDTTRHLALASWLKLLESVTFTPETAVDR